MRLTCDVLADDGAAVMTAVSSATLAIANAGIPLASPVAGAQALHSAAPIFTLGFIINTFSSAVQSISLKVPQCQMTSELAMYRCSGC